jgi:mRNA-degrading endonuclease RelE of RelBE toxin-antitoxin system
MTFSPQIILALAHNPRPFGSEKLQGFENLYRLRIGKYPMDSSAAP